jgi:hypothetical protein
VRPMNLKVAEAFEIANGSFNGRSTNSSCN